MVIRKQYDIGQLVEQLQTEIKNSKKCSVVKIDILTANDILEVLRETHRREQKHQTLESETTFIEKEDGTQTNEMEMHNKDKMPDCYSMITGSYEICERCRHNKSCVYRVRKKEDKTKQTNEPVCFGEYNEDYLGCLMCMYGDECLKETKNKEQNK